MRYPDIEAVREPLNWILNNDNRGLHPQKARSLLILLKELENRRDLSLHRGAEEEDPMESMTTLSHMADEGNVLHG